MRELGVIARIASILTCAVAKVMEGVSNTEAAVETIARVVSCISALCKGNAKCKISWREAGGGRTLCDLAGSERIMSFKTLRLPVNDALRDTASGWDLEAFWKDQCRKHLLALSKKN